MHVKDLGAAVDTALLHRVAQVAAGDGRGRIAEHVGAVGGGLVEAADGLLLQGQAVHEGLATVVHRPVAGAVGGSVGIHLDHQRALPVQVPVALVPTSW